MQENIRAHLMISGRVQGVFYRMETKSAADRIGVFGWVRNKRDGRVEVVVEGEKQKVEMLIQWCKTGPPAARVQDVDVAWEQHKGGFTSFEVTY